MACNGKRYIRPHRCVFGVKGKAVKILDVSGVVFQENLDRTRGFPGGFYQCEVHLSVTACPTS